MTTEEIKIKIPAYGPCTYMNVTEEYNKLNELFAKIKKIETEDNEQVLFIAVIMDEIVEARKAVLDDNIDVFFDAYRKALHLYKFYKRLYPDS
jgi:hypothetical protein